MLYRNKTLNASIQIAQAIHAWNGIININKITKIDFWFLEQ